MDGSRANLTEAGALTDRLPLSYMICYFVPIFKDALCSIRMNGTGIFQRTDGFNGGRESAYLIPNLENAMLAFRRECLL